MGLFAVHPFRIQSNPNQENNIPIAKEKRENNLRKKDRT